ncbi:unnamed protein product [Adineta steineri]|uniref:SAM-dependent methyltransferase TRM5/TYW2-type domain-containing protein n=1 Tax=Adineta steineri TaxID=433720 RepID=A0A813NRG8_9BILA|nr:unnamed protein product [Adineta steineri]
MRPLNLIKTILIEGNIGVGKSTIMSHIASNYSSNLVQVHREPIENWMDIKGFDLLKALYTEKIIAGDLNTIVTCRESKALFQFDFAKVYWNPRLSTEHERIIDILHKNDLVFDVFAGVGPFIVPASMRGCIIYANDLNPECFKWMTINLKKNQPKKSSTEYYIYNLDGREFLRTITLPHIENYQKDRPLLKNKITIIMNLPQLALTFLDVFSEWLSINSEEKEQWIIPVHIYCYTFSRADDRIKDIEIQLQTILPNVNKNQISCRFVRQVAPNKDMMCVNIRLFDKNSEQ